LIDTKIGSRDLQKAEGCIIELCIRNTINLGIATHKKEPPLINAKIGSRDFQKA